MLLRCGLHWWINIEPGFESHVAVTMQAAKPAITGAQIRAARALLHWSVHDLSERCGVSESAISRAEKVDGVPGMQGRNLNAVRTAFEIHGIEFLDGTGLRMRPR